MLFLFVFIIKISKMIMKESQAGENSSPQWRGSWANSIKLHLRSCQLSAPVDWDKLLAFSPQSLPQASHSWPFKWLLIRSTESPPAGRKGEWGEQRRGGERPSNPNNTVYCNNFHSVFAVFPLGWTHTLQLKKFKKLKCFFSKHCYIVKNDGLEFG